MAASMAGPNRTLKLLRHSVFLMSTRLKSSSSRRWIARQESDPYVERAHQMGLRARSAFKIIEMNKRFKLLRPGMAVVECGAAPGAWTQVTAPIVTRGGSAGGVVVGCDILDMEPVDGAILFPRADFTAPETQARILEALAGRKPMLVMSDMAAAASGVAELDGDATAELASSALRFALLHSARGGSFLTKVFNGRGASIVAQRMDVFYSEVKRVKPKSSRLESAEIYLLGNGFKGAKLRG